LDHSIEFRSFVFLQRVNSLNLASKNKEAVGIALRVKNIVYLFFLNYTVQRRCSQHARTLTPMNTRTETLPLLAPSDLEIPEVTNGASSSTGTSLTT
jgi:hypothetical protein